MAAICALTWSGYSVISRRLGDAPTSSVTVFCVASAVGSGVLHLLLVETIWPAGAHGWPAVPAWCDCPILSA